MTPRTGDEDPTTLWGGRFAEPPSDVLWRYTVDHTDRRLLAADIEGSIAHVAMLREVGLISEAEHAAIDRALARMLTEAGEGAFRFADDDEDVHTAVERRLVELVGEAGEKLHTGRSRNDQMALDLRLYLRRAVEGRSSDLVGLAAALADVAEREATTLIPTYTHLQQAQTTSLGHHLLAYAWMALRDRQRMLDLAARLEDSPLGAGASAGSALPLDPAFTAARLGFSATFANSLDAVGGRDLVTEFVFVAAQAMVHLSRLSEEFVLWSTKEFGWVSLPDALATGSSALPHKKNPDIAELARGKAAGVIGDLMALLALQKGLPLAYNRDLQEDKPPLFRADDALAGSVEALGALVSNSRFHPPPPGPWVAALDLAEALVERGVSFRQAHQTVGRLVAAMATAQRSPSELTMSDLKAIDGRFDDSDLDRLNPTTSLSRRKTPGSGTPDSVRHQIEEIRRIVAK
ncbi:MAG: argininosuccinate lyase [Acidimicrobiia bacterium]